MKNRYTATLALLLIGFAASNVASADSDADATDATAAQLKITHADERATRADLSEYFTGNALVNPLFDAEDSSHATAAVVTFEPGARTNWHTHPVGQQLVVTGGVGWVKIEGQPKQTVRAGDVIWTPAGAKHWHGATPDHSMTHIAIQERGDGQNVVWGEPVTDAEYQAEQ